ncbi:3-oxoacyl-[acyl-carrier-protein] reductase [Halomicronema hongdechloris C2206]|uniref:3-oxoacyl-[acyl-carrier-protein] reductase n=1 Tax=Halomicronema hongdechloris C2206 TaxID=1641165 RepID=A0A1Z3HL01_9CYAN|nr:3-oxoacyl-ACP reductase FabG [Halomicronema hongdechloris]ASC70989.1 3-oxoacyl-[acyl-carrier-protein] reductase [Halomicronema hongdechloris C2206]
MQGQQILITGGTGGLGQGVTREALNQGAYLTLPYRNQDEVEQLKQNLAPAQLERVRFLQADLSDETTVVQLIAEMTRLDGLIHLVGGFAMGAIADYSFQEWRHDFDLNLHTTFLACKYSLKKMQAQGYGRIVTIGSRGAVQPAAQLGAYCASKAAVVALTRAIAAETKGSRITANSVLPSIIDTPANREAMGTEQVDQWVKPASLARVICFLASEAAGDIRGATVPVYGDS